MALIDNSLHEDGANGGKDVQHKSFVYGLQLRGRHSMLLLIKCNFHCSFDLLINITSVFPFNLVKIPLSFGGGD